VGSFRRYTSHYGDSNETHTNQQHDNWVCPKHFKFGIVTGKKKTYHANVLPDRNGDGVVEPKICKWENKQGYTHMNYIYNNQQHMVQ
jgi:hypothetical protein